MASSLFCGRLVKSGLQVVHRPFSLEKGRTGTGWKTHELHLLVPDRDDRRVVYPDDQGNMLFYTLFGHELLTLRGLKIVPGYGQFVSVPGKDGLHFVEGLFQGTVVHVEDLDLGRLGNCMSVEPKAKENENGK